MNQQVLAGMRQRVEQCRRLAKHVGDPQTVKTLRAMADEIEADIRRLEVERGERGSEPAA